MSSSDLIEDLNELDTLWYVILVQSDDYHHVLRGAVHLELEFGALDFELPAESRPILVLFELLQALGSVDL